MKKNFLLLACLLFVATTTNVFLCENEGLNDFVAVTSTEEEAVEQEQVYFCGDQELNGLLNELGRKFIESEMNLTDQMNWRDSCEYLFVCNVDRELIIKIIDSMSRACCRGNTCFHYFAAVGQDTLKDLDRFIPQLSLFIPFSQFIQRLAFVDGYADMNAKNEYGLTPTDLARDHETEALLRRFGGRKSDEFGVRGFFRRVARRMCC